MRFLVEKIQAEFPERQDMSLWWVGVYALVVNAIAAGCGFVPPEEQDDGGDADRPVIGPSGIIDGGHRNPRTPRSEAAA